MLAVLAAVRVTCVVCPLLKTSLGACSGVAVVAEHGPQRLSKSGRSSVA